MNILFDSTENKNSKRNFSLKMKNSAKKKHWIFKRYFEFRIVQNYGGQLPVSFLNVFLNKIGTRNTNILLVFTENENSKRYFSWKLKNSAKKNIEFSKNISSLGVTKTMEVDSQRIFWMFFLISKGRETRICYWFSMKMKIRNFKWIFRVREWPKLWRSTPREFFECFSW